MVEISLPYICSGDITAIYLSQTHSSQKKMTSHSCVSLILQISQTQIHWSFSSYGGKLHSKLDPVWRNPRGISQTRKAQEKFQIRAQE